MGISMRLKELRKQKGITQRELAEQSGIPLRSIVNYENSSREPNSKAMAVLEQFFNVSGRYLRGETEDSRLRSWDDEDVMDAVYDGLSRISAILIEKARESDECSKKMTYDILIEFKHILSLDSSKKPVAMMLLQEVFGITTRFIDSRLYSISSNTYQLEKIKKSRIQDLIYAFDNFDFESNGEKSRLSLADFEENESDPIMREVSVYFQPASAGTGTFLDSDDYDIVEFPMDYVPINTSFGVKVSGDSMEPKFLDDDIVFVRQQPVVENAEIGIFVLNGEAYIKKLYKENGTIKLISLNNEYEPLEVGEDDSFRVVGKVIGTVKNWR